jgi:hypothetical protein
MTVCLLIFFAWPKREGAEHIIVVGGGLMRDEDVAALKKCTSKK